MRVPSSGTTAVSTLFWDQRGIMERKRAERGVIIHAEQQQQKRKRGIEIKEKRGTEILTG